MINKWNKFNRWLWWRGIHGKDLLCSLVSLAVIIAAVVFMMLGIVGCASKKSVIEPRIVIVDVEFPEDDTDLDDLPEANISEDIDDDGETYENY